MGGSSRVCNFMTQTQPDPLLKKKKFVTQPNPPGSIGSGRVCQIGEFFAHPYIQVNPICLLCNDGVESVVHAILRCNIASNVWRMWDDCPISLMGNNMDISDLAMEILHQGTQKDLEKIFEVAWRIWYNRNQVLHEANGTFETHI